MSKQIDLEKLRRLATEANTPEQWYLESDLTSCSYSYDKAFIAEFSPSVAMELLYRIAELEKDAARYQFLRDSSCKDLWDKLMNTLPFAHSSFDRAIDTAMEAKQCKSRLMR